MAASKRPVVQLTPLLDLLFIMIFVSMLTPIKKSDADANPNDKAGIVESVEDLKQQISKMEHRLKMTSIEDTSDVKQSMEAGVYRRLFVANVYYLDGKYSYKETRSFLADKDTGIHSIRLNLSEAGVISGTSSPMTKEQAVSYKQCSESTITREVISETCQYTEQRSRKLSCNRTKKTEYMCKQTQVIGSKIYEWNYKLELLTIDDPSLD